MSDLNNHEKDQELNNKAREEARLHRQEEDKIVSSTLADTDFLKEKIKERPINKKRLLRRTLMTVGMAVLFGLVACITFALLQPFISGKLTKTEEVKVSPVLFPEETSELNPQDMVADEYQLQIIRREATETGTEESLVEGNEGVDNPGENGAGEGSGTQQGEVTEHTGNASGEGEPDPLEETEVAEDLTAMEAASLELADYRNAYAALRKLTDEFSKSLVTVTALSEDGSWINMSLRNSDQTSGLVLAENGRDLLILVKYDDIKRAAKIIVTFNNGKELPAQIVQADMVTGYAILAVELAELDSVTASRIAFPTLGSSVGNSLIGQPVIALGAPNGTYGSVYYGTITSQNEAMGLTDSDYRLIRTDIYGSGKANGILINLDGQVVGILYNGMQTQGMSNQLCAIGISSLKKTIEKISNDQNMPYLGVHGAELSTALRVEYGLPAGAVITSIEVDSPAMAAGIQSGDIISTFNGEDVASFAGLVSKLNQTSVGDEIEMTINRQQGEEYTQMTVTATLRAQNGAPAR
ncbi:MAG: serine protease [Lachnospiraceae bacterium]|nr:serine protease [Lachnospiraceae bacterium]